MNKLCLIGLGAACGVVVLASFLPWLAFRPRVDLPGMPAGELQAMQSALQQALTITGWNGHVTLFGLTLPNWLVPIAAASLAIVAWLQSAAVLESRRGIRIALAGFCLGHLLILLLVVTANPGSTSLGFGAVLATLGSVAMLGLTIFAPEEEPFETVRIPVSRPSDFTEPARRPAQHLTR